MNQEAKKLHNILMCQAMRGRTVNLGLDDREIFVEYRLHDLISLMRAEVSMQLALMFTDPKAGQELFDTRYQHDCMDDVKVEAIK